MKSTAKGVVIAAMCQKASRSIENQIQEDKQKLEELYRMRMVDENHKAAWERAKLGLERANEIRKRLDQMLNQASAMNECEITLSEEECVFFSFSNLS